MLICWIHCGIVFTIPFRWTSIFSYNINRGWIPVKQVFYFAVIPWTSNKIWTNFSVVLEKWMLQHNVLWSFEYIWDILRFAAEAFEVLCIKVFMVWIWMWFWSSSQILQLFFAGFIFHAQVSMLLPAAPAMASGQPRQLPSQAWPMQLHPQVALQSQRFLWRMGKSIAFLSVCVYIIVSCSLYI